MPGFDGTWYGMEDYYTDYNDYNNWLNGVVCGTSGRPVTLTIEAIDPSYQPNSNLPTYGWFTFVVNSAGEYVLDEWLGEPQNQGDIVIQGVIVSNSGAEVSISRDEYECHPSTLTVNAGSFTGYSVTGPLHLAAETTVTLFDAVVYGAAYIAGTLKGDTNLTDISFDYANDPVTLDGGTIAVGFLTFFGGIEGSGTVGDGRKMVITGGVNLYGGATWDVGEDSSIYDDVGGVFDPGTSDPIDHLLYASIVPVVLGRNMAIHSLTISGDFDGNGKTVTLSGEFIGGSGTLAGTLTVKAGEGGFVRSGYTDGSGTLNIEVPEGVSCSGDWYAELWDNMLRISELKVEGELSGDGYRIACRRLTGDGTIINGYFVVEEPNDEFCTFSDTIGDGTAPVQLYVALAKDTLNTAPISLLAPTLPQASFYVSKEFTLTLCGGLSCGHLRVFDKAVLKVSSVLNTNGGPVILGTAGSAVNYGRLVLEAGRHSIGPLYRYGSANLNCGVTYGGTVAVSGDQTLASLVTTFGAASIVLASGKNILGASAVTPTSAGAHAHGGAVTNLALTAANPLYRFGDTSGDSGNGAGVIKCPAPASPSCMPMAA